MKSSCTHTTLALLTLLTFASLAVAQNVSGPQAGYTYAMISSPGATGTYAYSINNKGVIVGFITGGECSQISNQSSCGFIDKKGTFTYVACELENATDFFDISNSGEVVGAYSFFGGVNGLIWEGNQSCFPLADPLSSGTTEAFGVASGKVVGFYVDSAGHYQGFLYTGKTQAYKTIACPGWADTRALAINAAGVIVGDVSNSTSGPFSGFIYKGGKCTTILNYPNSISTSARGVNKHGQISGNYQDSGGNHGFVWTAGSFVPLDYPNSTGTIAVHLNDAGKVAGFYADANGGHFGFVATPN